jgi:tetratricopeptide (TPR) repeat protein
VSIIAAGICAYYNSFQGPFVFDDVGNILENSTIHQVWPIWKTLSPPREPGITWRPIFNLSLAVNYSLGNTRVWGYHALNLAIHILAALTLFGIVRRTLSCPQLRERFGATADWIALAVAVLWTVHPLQTEAVTYITQRCESLMGLFYLLTLYGFIRGVQSKSPAGWFSFSAAACFLGMATKEVMVTAPAIVLLYDRTFVGGNVREAWIRHRRLYLGLACSWLLLAYLMIGLPSRSIGFDAGISWWSYALTECRVIVQYLRLAVWPHPLVFDYGDYLPIRHLAALASYALILAVVVAVVLFELKRHPAVGFLGAWFLVILAPTSSVVPISGSPMAEHRMYLSLAAVVTLIVLAAFAIGERGFTKRLGIVVGCVGVGCVAVTLTFLTVQRNHDYRSELGIWQDTVANRPNNPRAQSGLGLALMGDGKLPEALAHFQQALSIRPDYAEAHYNLGLAADQLGRTTEAIGHYERALRIQLDYAAAHNNLGADLMRLGRLQEGIAHYEQALRIRPDYAAALNNLGLAMVQQGRLKEAIADYDQALRIDPDYADAHNNLGIALVRLGRAPEAIEQYQQALRIKPGFAVAHNNLGLALVQQGQIAEAIGEYEQALRINPDYAKAHNDLATALAQMGKMPEAIEHWTQALRINPDYAEAHYNLGLALEQSGRTNEATIHFEQALRIQPDFAPAQNALARAQQ